MGDHPDRKGAAREETLAASLAYVHSGRARRLRRHQCWCVGHIECSACESATTVLTVDQANRLTLVLNRLIPAEGAMPAAGTLGVAGSSTKLRLRPNTCPTDHWCSGPRWPPPRNLQG